MIRNLGRTDYEATWGAMQAFTAARTAATPDELWLTEHPPVYTLGLAGRREHLLRENGIPAIKVDRGGQITYHGPGQLVAYTLVDLRRSKLTVRTMVRAIEAAVIEWLATLNIAAYGKPAAPGVYVARESGEAKIGALGLRVKNGCTYHGLAVTSPWISRRSPTSIPAVTAAWPSRRSPISAWRARLPKPAPSSRRSSPATSSSPDDRRENRHRPLDFARSCRCGSEVGGCQGDGRREDGAHPDQGRRHRAPEEAGVDPRARGRRRALPRDQADPARGEAQHRVRGSLLPQHRGMLRARHRDLHDHGRPVHAALPLLRRGARPAAAARSGRAAAPRRDDRRDEARLRRGHERGPRRPARRRRLPLRSLLTLGAHREKQERHREAADLYHKAIQDWPNDPLNPKALIAYGRLMLEVFQQLDDTLAILEGAVQNPQTTPEFRRAAEELIAAARRARRAPTEPQGAPLVAGEFEPTSLAANPAEPLPQSPVSPPVPPTPSFETDSAVAAPQEEPTVDAAAASLPASPELAVLPAENPPGEPPADAIPAPPPLWKLLPVTMRAVDIDTRGLRLQSREGKTGQLPWQTITGVSVART